MHTKPLISILSSVYNERAYIEATIESVLKQTYEHWEWIIVDDGSSDGTKNILKRIQDKRVQLVFQERTGSLAKNLNKALVMSNGTIIAALDGDDYWPKNKIELQIESFDDPDVVLSYGECAIIDAKGECIGHVRLPDDSRVAHNDPRGCSLMSLLANVDCFICNTSVMYRKSSLLHVGAFYEKTDLPPDHSTWVLLSLSGKFSPVHSCLGYYRKHLASMSFTRDHVSTYENQIAFFREFLLRSRQPLHDSGMNFDMDTLEKSWRKIKVKTRIVQGLMRLSSLIGVDMVNPIVVFINRNTPIKKMIQRMMNS